MAGKHGSPEHLGMSSIAVKGGIDLEVGEGVAPPIHMASTFYLPGDPEPGGYTYARAGSPGFLPLERTLGQLEGASGSIVTNAGMASANALLEEFVPGTALVMPRDTYFGIRVRAQQLTADGRGELRLVDISDLAAVEAALPGASLLWVETPTNPNLAVADLAGISRVAATAGVRWVCDNTFASPVLQRPLEYGAWAVMESLTKYIGGHSDLLLGAAFTNDPELEARLRARRSSTGTQPDGFSCWLARRGLQTMPLRVRAQSAAALDLAARLVAHPKISAVYYPGLPTHPGHAIAAAQMTGGFGGMMSIIVRGGGDAAQRVVDAVRVWVPATSLGGVESLIERRYRWEGDAVDPALVRMSVGLEDVEDIWGDLERALAQA